MFQRRKGTIQDQQSQKSQKQNGQYEKCSHFCDFLFLFFENVLKNIQRYI